TTGPRPTPAPRPGSCWLSSVSTAWRRSTRCCGPRASAGAGSTRAASTAAAGAERALTPPSPGLLPGGSAFEAAFPVVPVVLADERRDRLTIGLGPLVAVEAPAAHDLVRVAGDEVDLRVPYAA